MTSSKDHLFKPGHSGNLNGRPVVYREFRELCRQVMERPNGGWEKLTQHALDEDSKYHMPALKMIAAYGYGLPPQKFDITRTDTHVSALSGLSTEELRAFLQIPVEERRQIAQGLTERQQKDDSKAIETEYREVG